MKQRRAAFANEQMQFILSINLRSSHSHMTALLSAARQKKMPNSNHMSKEERFNHQL
jgi:hypothetical protein